MPKFTIIYTIEGSIEFEAETPAIAVAKFEALDQRTLGELGELVVLSEPLVEDVERSISDAGMVVGSASQSNAVGRG